MHIIEIVIICGEYCVDIGFSKKVEDLLLTQHNKFSERITYKKNEATENKITVVSDTTFMQEYFIPNLTNLINEYDMQDVHHITKSLEFNYKLKTSTVSRTQKKLIDLVNYIKVFNK